MNEAHLPGIGKKFWIDTEEGERLTVIRHNSGRYELYFIKKGEDFPSAVLPLTEYEARDLGSVLFGRFERRVVETMEVALKDLIIEWARLGEGSAIANQSIRDLDVRAKTGATIAALIRGEHGIPSPSPEEVVKPGDMLLLMGSKEQIDAFKKML